MPEWAALFTFSRSVQVTCSLRFTSGVTPANLLAAGMAAEPISSTGIGGARNQDLLHHRQVLCD